jgi:hypothetical protein
MMPATYKGAAKERHNQGMQPTVCSRAVAPAADAEREAESRFFFRRW